MNYESIQFLGTKLKQFRQVYVCTKPSNVKMAIFSNPTFCIPCTTFKSLEDPGVEQLASELFSVRTMIDGGLNKDGKTMSLFFSLDPCTSANLTRDKRVKKALRDLAAGRKAKIPLDHGFYWFTISKHSHHQQTFGDVVEGWNGDEFYEIHRRRVLELATNPTPPAEVSAASAEAEPEIVFGD